MDVSDEYTIVGVCLCCVFCRGDGAVFTDFLPGLECPVELYQSCISFSERRAAQVVITVLMGIEFTFE